MVMHLQKSIEQSEQRIWGGLNYFPENSDIVRTSEFRPMGSTCALSQSMTFLKEFYHSSKLMDSQKIFTGERMT